MTISSSNLSVRIVCFLAAVAMASGAAAQQPGPGKAKTAGNVRPPKSFAGQTHTVLTPANLSRLVTGTLRERWRGAVNEERLRGNLMDLYAQVAPAVVVVRTREGHGSGFFIDAKGYLLTNNHVVENGTFVDKKRGVSFARIHLGRLDVRGQMKLHDDPVDAYVCAVDPGRDLALLKLVTKPGWLDPIPFIPLATAFPRPGQAGAILGHPSSGMLWTFRPSVVSASGRFPHDLMDFVMSRLFASSSQRPELERDLKRIRAHGIIISSTAVTHGDSGGPLVDENGQLIGVTFAGPRDSADDKFTYHVGLDEVKGFLAEASRKPRLLVPDPWDLGPRIELRDLLHEGRPQTLIAGAGERPEQVLFDVDGDTPGALFQRGDLRALVADRRFDAEVVLHFSPSHRTSFFDTDGDDNFDLILVDFDPDDSADRRYRRAADGTWRVEDDINLEWFRPDYLKDPSSAKRLLQLARALP